MRHVFVHYHIFKNAGTSLDFILRNSLAEAWVEWDPGEATGVVTPDQLGTFIRSHPKFAAVSSHLARPPAPLIEGVSLHPLIFVRHPIMRAASVYKYERTSHVETESARFAATRTFREYVAWQLHTGARTIRDFQTIYLSGARLRLRPGEPIDVANEYERALAFVKSLPAFGIVERFGDSIRLFQKTYEDVFPQIKWFETRTNESEPELATVEEMHEALGDDLYSQLERENVSDLRLYEQALLLFDSVSRPQ